MCPVTNWQIAVRRVRGDEWCGIDRYPLSEAVLHSPGAFTARLYSRRNPQWQQNPRAKLYCLAFCVTLRWLGAGHVGGLTARTRRLWMLPTFLRLWGQHYFLPDLTHFWTPKEWSILVGLVSERVCLPVTPRLFCEVRFVSYLIMAGT